MAKIPNGIRRSKTLRIVGAKWKRLKNRVKIRRIETYKGIFKEKDLKLMTKIVASIMLLLFSATAANASATTVAAAANASATAANASKKSGDNMPPPGMVSIPGGSFMMGADSKQARVDEFPKHPVTVSAFYMDTTAVTHKQFKAFVQKTGYVTTAEQKPDWEVLKQQLPPGTPKPPEDKLVAASIVFTPPNHPVPLNDVSQWWSWVPGANWKHPRGPESSNETLENHPVVQVSYEDAVAYCEWVEKRLPTEAEWEWAARGGLKDNIYPWGNEPINEGKIKANTWQGEFPHKNTAKKSDYYTVPVKSYAANGYGLYEMAGNVWEWVHDWYRSDYYAQHEKETLVNPKGPNESYDEADPSAPKRVIRGGSFLCADSYCAGYRVSARMKTSSDTSMEHLGFRCAKSQ